MNCHNNSRFIPCISLGKQGTDIGERCKLPPYFNNNIDHILRGMHAHKLP